MNIKMVLLLCDFLYGPEMEAELQQPLVADNGRNDNEHVEMYFPMRECESMQEDKSLTVMAG